MPRGMWCVTCALFPKKKEKKLLLQRKLREINIFDWKCTKKNVLIKHNISTQSSEKFLYSTELVPTNY